MKKIILLLLLSLTLTLQLLAQVRELDSSVIRKETALVDAKRFKLTKQIRKAYRNHMLTHTSDYFNPTVDLIRKPNFVSDSVYVKTYKNAAYTTVKKIRLNRKIITGSIVIAGLVALPFVVAKGLNSLLSDARSKIQ